MNHMVAAAAGPVLVQLSFFSTLLKSLFCLLLYPSSSSSSPKTVPYTLQDVLDFQEFYRHRTFILGHFPCPFMIGLYIFDGTLSKRF